MAEIMLTSILSEDEINENFKNTNVFEGIMQGLEDVVAFEKGDTSRAYIRKRALPDIDVVATRKTLHLTQKQFADKLGVSVRTVESWETGRTTPTPTAVKLIYLINRDNSLLAYL